MNVFELFASLFLDSSQYDEALDDAEKKGSSFGDNLKKGLATGAKVAAGAVVAVGTATVAAGKALVDATGNVAAQGDAIDKNSQKLGISATAYQEWDAILQHSGTSISALTPAMKTLQAQTEGDGEAFAALGLSMDEVGQMSNEELFAAVITGLQNMGDESDRNSIAADLLGKSYMELQPLLNTSAEDTEAMRQAVHDLGGVMSDDMIAASAAYSDSLQDMNTAMDGAKTQIIGTFLPSVTSVMDGLTLLFSGDSGSGIDKINQGVSDFLTNLFDTAPQIVEVGSQLLTNLLQVIVENLPNLVQAGMDLIMNLATGILDQLPTIVDAITTIVTNIIQYILQNLPTLLEKGIEIIKSIAEGMIQNLPAIIQAIGDILLALVDFIMQDLPNILAMGLELIQAIAQGIIQNLPTIIAAMAEILVQLVQHILQNLPQFIQTGIQLIIQIITGLIQAIPQIIAALPQIFQAIINAFAQTDWLSVGKDIIMGIVSGIGGAVSALWDAAVNAARAALNKIKSILGIHSPSRVFRDQIGKMIPEGMAIGIEANADEVEDAMEDLSDLTTDPFGGNAYTVNSGTVGGRGVAMGGVVINVYPREGQDEEQIAEYVMQKMQLEYDRAERRLA